MWQLLILMLMSLGQYSRADMPENEYDFFGQSTALLNSHLDDSSKNILPNPYNDLQKNDFLNQDQVEPDLQFLQNQLYENEKFRFYNHTRYDLGDAKTKYLQHGVQELSLSDLNISLGYGLEYKLSKFQTLGYEYLSAFPNDYGQSIRFFWKKSF